jgi:hypothetical protein
MLKIKDNVDLKELEKYGFEYDEDVDIYEKDLNIYDEFDCNNLTVGEDRVICWNYCWELGDDAYSYFGALEDDMEDKVDDLIKADLVEKVD